MEIYAKFSIKLCQNNHLNEPEEIHFSELWSYCFFEFL